MNPSICQSMKKRIQFVTAGALIAMMIFSTSVMAQPDPGGGGDPGGGVPPVGGGAPVGSGLVILIILCITYGLYKMYKSKRHNLTELQV
jgi:hypothetical protein